MAQELHPLDIEENRAQSLSTKLKRNFEKKLIAEFGFIASTTIPVWENAKITLSKMQCKEYYRHCNELAYHNLCSDNSNPPNNIGKLLGLGLKFCIQERRPPGDSIDHGIARLQRDVRLKYFFAEEDEFTKDDDDQFDGKLYIKSKWQPPPANKNVEDRVLALHKSITNEREKIKQGTKPSTNITPEVEQIIRDVTKNKNFIVLLTDKNLGPAIMERTKYLKLILEEHLLDNQTYQQLTENETFTRNRKFVEGIRESMEEYGDQLTIRDQKYISRGFETCDRMPQFYGMPKVHKKPDPEIPFRPVTSQCGSFAAVISKVVDYYLQQMIVYVPSFVKNSRQVLQLLSDQKLRRGQKLFTSGAKSMFSNIDP